MPYDTPAWTSTAVIYQIFPRAFSAKGDFRSIIPELSRIRSLGADIVWLTPIHPISHEARKGSWGSPYAIDDYRAVNPDFGTEDDLAALATAVKSHGMKLMIDVVYNHTGVGSVLSKEHPEWFFQRDGRIGRKFDEWSDVWDLDHAQPGLADYLIDCLEKWVRLGVEGFRCDVASMVPREFWVEARRRINAGREILWLAESTHTHFLRFLKGRGYTAVPCTELHDAFDLTYDYDGFEIMERVRSGRAALQEYLNHVNTQTYEYPSHVRKLRFLENHDQPRAAQVHPGLENLMNWTVFYLMLPGPSLVYAGQEVRETRQPSLFEREPLDWDWSRDISSFLSAGIVAAREAKSARLYSYESLSSGVVRIDWNGGGATYSALVNLEGRSGFIPLASPIRGVNLLTGKPFEASGSVDAATLPVIVRHA